MKYNHVINFINQIECLGSRPGLTRINHLLDKIGNPEKDLKVIHVAGTNGKGSVSSMLQFILMNAGYRVGMYTSPHLQSYNERIKINNEDISNKDFGYIGEKIMSGAEKCKEEGGELPTVFESLTAMALLYFAEKKVDVVILEVGLGGRFDATNVIEKPLVSVITSIGTDHRDVLGDNIESIAYEKAGIIKKNCSTVLYFPNTLVYNIINEICHKRNSTLYYDSNMIIYDIIYSFKKTNFSIKTDLYCYNNLELSLLGEHQIYNAALALSTVEVLKRQGLTISEYSIRKGLRECYWPGRMEVVKKEPLLILDGMHNEESAQALSLVFRQYLSNKNITLLIGVLNDKPYIKMLKLLLPFVKKVVITEPDNVRKLSVDELEKEIKRYSVEILKSPNVKEALCLAINSVSKEDVLCCAGSLYLVGKIKSYLS